MHKIGADVSYYTAKIRAYLVHKSLPFVEVLATRKVFNLEAAVDRCET